MVDTSNNEQPTVGFLLGKYVPQPPIVNPVVTPPPVPKEISISKLLSPYAPASPTTPVITIPTPVKPISTAIKFSNHPEPLRDYYEEVTTKYIHIEKKAKLRTKVMYTHTEENADDIYDYDAYNYIDGIYMKVNNRYLEYVAKNLSLSSLMIDDFLGNYACSYLCDICHSTERAENLHTIIDRFLRDGLQGCTSCRHKQRRMQHAIKEEQEFDINGSPLEEYTRVVRQLSEVMYEEYIDIINPLKLIRGGGNYDMDHILCISECFSRKIPVALCANPYNLQMLTHHDNLVKGTSTPSIIPVIFKSHYSTYK